MTLQSFILIFKTIAWALSPNWPPSEIETRATEFYEVGKQTDIDPLLLVTISIYECDLQDNKDEVYSDKNGIYARDLCPMGFHYETHSNKVGANLPRKEIILLAAQTLNLYQSYHERNHHKKHSYLQHYNSGYSVINSGAAALYSNNVLYLRAIISDRLESNKYTSLRAKQLGSKLYVFIHQKDNFYQYCELSNSNWSYSCHYPTPS